MPKKNSETYGNNIKYLIDCVSPAFTLSKYVPKQTFYNLNISLSTLKKALYGENLSVKTARQIADSFCHYLSDSTKSRIIAEDLYLPPNDTAGFATFCVNTPRRLPCPPAKSMAIISFLIMLSPLTSIFCEYFVLNNR